VLELSGYNNLPIDFSSFSYAPGASHCLKRIRASEGLAGKIKIDVQSNHSSKLAFFYHRKD